MSTLRLAVLASGGGRSLENLVLLVAQGELDVELGLVLTDRQGSGAIERAQRLGIDHVVLPYREFGNPTSFSQRAFEEIEAHGCNRIVLAGFLRLLKLPDPWRGRVMNIHPSLLPKFGGKGFYGERVHQAVIEAGEKVSGCTVHLIDDRYDRGEILLQREVPVLANDTAESLGARVFEEEKRALPAGIRMWMEGEVGSWVRTREDHDLGS